jgi:hypothetical protein
MAEQEKQNESNLGRSKHGGVVRPACTIPDWAEAWRNRQRCPKRDDDFNGLGSSSSCDLHPGGSQDRSYQAAVHTLKTYWLSPAPKENQMPENTDNRPQRPSERCCRQCGEPISCQACYIAVKAVHDLHIPPGTSTADVLAEIGLREEYSLVNDGGVPFTLDQHIHAACLHGEEFFAVCE